MDSCLPNTCCMLSLVSSPGAGDQAMSCPPPRADSSAPLPHPKRTKSSGRREGLYKDPCSDCFAPQNDGLPRAAQISVSFPSAVNTTSGFEIKGDSLADEFTARCWLLECTTVDLIQSTRDRRAPTPTPGLWTPHNVTSPTRSLQKQSLVGPARFGMEKNGVDGKSRLRTTIQGTQATFRL